MGLTDLYGAALGSGYLPPNPQSQPTPQPLYVSPLAAATGVAPSLGSSPPPPVTMGPPPDYASLAGAALQGQGMGSPTTMAPAPTEAPKLYDPTAAGGMGAAAAPTEPFRVPPQVVRTVQAHDVQLGSDKGIAAKTQAAEEAKGALGGLGQAQMEENESNAQALAGYQGQVRGYQLEQEGLDKETQAKIQKAQDAYANASDIDPERYMSKMSTGKRILLMASAGLMQAGMGLRGQSGTNPVLDLIERETQRDIDAQKSARDKKLSLYHQAREQGLTDMQAHALAYKNHADMAKIGLDAAVAGNHSPVLQQEVELHKAAIDDQTANYFNKAYGHAQAQTGVAGGIPKEVRDLAAKIRLDPRYTGSSEAALAEAARTLGMPLGGPQGTFAPPQGAGAGRSAGVQMEYQQNLNRYDAFLHQLDQAEKMVNEGGHLDPARTAQGKTLLNAMAAELGYVNAGKSPNETELATAQSMLPSDLNAYQFTGADKAKLAQVRKIIEEKRASLMKAGPAIAGGSGFAPGQTQDQAAAQFGAVEK